jgi:tagatose 6-phosphate kinase
VVSVILTVTLNPALDVTYRVEALQPGHPHRVDGVSVKAGGKGVSVARVLAMLGERVLATGLIGGLTGDSVIADLPVPHDFARITGESRRAVTVWSTSDCRATLFAERGPTVLASEWSVFISGFDRLASVAEVVVLAGSLPPGLPDSAYAELIVRSRAPVILDAADEPLRRGLAAHPAMITPNADDLAAAIGSDAADLVEACRELAVPVAFTLGPEGAVLSTPAGSWSARPPAAIRGKAAVAGNSTGTRNATSGGDAFTAALARGLARRSDPPALLADAVALSTASVLAPASGDFDPATYERLRTAVEVRRL